MAQGTVFSIFQLPIKKKMFIYIYLGKYRYLDKYIKIFW